MVPRTFFTEQDLKSRFVICSRKQIICPENGQPTRVFVPVKDYTWGGVYGDPGNLYWPFSKTVHPE